MKAMEWKVKWAAWVLLVAAPTWAQEAETLRFSGATTVQPIAERLGALYTERHGARTLVAGGGTGAGIRHTLSGEVDLGMVSRSLRENEKEELQYATVGYDALVIIVNAQNPLTQIDRTTLVRLFSGRVGNWREITDWEEPVVLVNKEIGRATLDLFEDYSGLRHPDRSAGTRGHIAAAAHEIGANVEALILVGGLRGAIGYVSMGSANELLARGMPIRVLELDGVQAEVAEVLSERYPVIRELNFVFRDRNGRIGDFLDLAFSAEGQRLVGEEGFIPARRR